MSRYVTFTLPDGSAVILESDEPDVGVIRAGIGEKLEQAGQTFEQAAESARKAALVVLEKVRGLHDAPSEVEITFGLKASGEIGSLVVAKAGAEASYSVTLKWRKLERVQRVRPRRVRHSHL
jgi:hypothetical protein